MRQRQFFRERRDMRGLGDRGLQKAAPHRRIKEEIAGDDGRAARCPDFFKYRLSATLGRVAYTGQRIPLPCDELNAGNRRDTGERLTAKA